jgi:hypothetical protein
MPTYEVIGRTEYRGHKPGAIFPAQLEPRAEARAIARHSIRRIDNATISLAETTHTDPTTLRNPDQETKP